MTVRATTPVAADATVTAPPLSPKYAVPSPVTAGEEKL